jgi:hypothetical protein
MTKKMGSEMKPRLPPANVGFGSRCHAYRRSEVSFGVDGSASSLRDVSTLLKFMQTDSNMICHALITDR